MSFLQQLFQLFTSLYMYAYFICTQPHLIFEEKSVTNLWAQCFKVLIKQFPLRSVGMKSTVLEIVQVQGLYQWQELEILEAKSYVHASDKRQLFCKVLSSQDWPFLRSPSVVLSGTNDLKCSKVKPLLSPVVNFNLVIQINIEACTLMPTLADHL